MSITIFIAVGCKIIYKKFMVNFLELSIFLVNILKRMAFSLVSLCMLIGIMNLGVCRDDIEEHKHTRTLDDLQYFVLDSTTSNKLSIKNPEQTTYKNPELLAATVTLGIASLSFFSYFMYHAINWKKEMHEYGHAIPCINITANSYMNASFHSVDLNSDADCYDQDCSALNFNHCLQRAGSIFLTGLTLGGCIELTLYRCAKNTDIKNKTLADSNNILHQDDDTLSDSSSLTRNETTHYACKHPCIYASSVMLWVTGLALYSYYGVYNVYNINNEICTHGYNNGCIIPCANVTENSSMNVTLQFLFDDDSDDFNTKCYDDNCSALYDRLWAKTLYGVVLSALTGVAAIVTRTLKNKSNIGNRLT